MFEMSSLKFCCNTEHSIYFLPSLSQRTSHCALSLSLVKIFTITTQTLQILIMHIRGFVSVPHSLPGSSDCAMARVFSRLPLVT